MGFLIYMTFKMMFKFCWWMLLLTLLLGWIMVVLPVAIVASLTGHDRTAHRWMRSVNWRRLL